MTYALSGALQAAVYDLLQSDPGLTAMIGDAVQHPSSQWLHIDKTASPGMQHRDHIGRNKGI